MHHEAYTVPTRLSASHTPRITKNMPVAARRLCRPPFVSCDSSSSIPHSAFRIRHLPFANRYSLFAVPLIAAVLLLLVCPGCRKPEPGFEIVTLEGKIDQIDATSDETGEITVVYYSEKHKQEMAGTGVVTRETEIMINGAIGTLKDLREGDRVRGEVRVEKKHGEKQQTVLKISVDRPAGAGTKGG